MKAVCPSCKADCSFNESSPPPNVTYRVKDVGVDKIKESYDVRCTSCPRTFTVDVPGLAPRP